MGKRLARALLTLMLCASLFLMGLSTASILRNPTLRPLIERSQDEILAATDRMLARSATPQRLEALITARLNEQPRNWLALEALHDLAVARGLPLPAAYETAHAEDSGFIAASADCLACIWDISQCSLSTALICKAPILMTPIEDLRGLTKAGVDYASGVQVDQLDLGLSVLGLGATAALIATGGSSGLVKAGAGTVKLARGMGRLSPKLALTMGDALKSGIRWADLPGLRSLDDLPKLMRADVLRPAADTLTDLGQVAEKLGPASTLHLLPLVDDAADAKRLANAATALGPRTLGTAEVLGKSRLLRATLRFGDEAVALVAGMVGLFTSLGLVLAQMVQSLVLRLLRRSLREAA